MSDAPPATPFGDLPERALRRLLVTALALPEGLRRRIRGPASTNDRGNVLKPTSS